MATVNKDFRVKNGLIVEGATGTINGQNILTQASNTDVLDEGTTNLYFTDQRSVDAVRDAIDGGTQTNISVTYSTSTGKFNFVAESGIDGATTDDLTEGTNNLYFTTSRVTGIIDLLTTDDLSEGTTNLYFTAQRAQDAVTENLSTDDIDEGTTNLYYTDTRVRSAISGGTGINFSTSTGEIDVDTETIATKTYVDEVAQGLKVRGSVEAATTADLGATYNNGTNGVGATLTVPATATLTIDAWTAWSVGDGVLVKDQTNAEENGRYFIDVVGDAGTAWVLKRCVDCDTPEEIPGSFVFVQHGTTYESTGWVATVANVDTFAVGVDDIDWVQFSGAGTFTAGNGIALNGNEFSVDFTEFDTEDVNEGSTNLYFTGQRSVDAVRSAIDGGTQTNISVTYSTSTGKFNFVAENGVEDSTTDNLSEGTTNLYFTDARAVGALEAVIPNFTEIDINSVVRQVAARVTAPTAVETVAYTFDNEFYRSAKFLVKVVYSSHTEVSEVLLTLDTSDNIAITEFAIVSTNGSASVISAGINGSNVELLVTPTNASSTITVVGTLLA